MSRRVKGCYLSYAVRYLDDKGARSYMLSPGTSAVDLIANKFGEAGLLSADSKGSEVRLPTPHNEGHRSKYIQLHATLLNTSQRKPRNRGLAKKPFDASGILDHYAEHDFGMAVIDELALCRMGSRDSRGLYVSAGTISFEPEAVGRDVESD